ncbi:MAG TPA: hypothetical protein VMV79_02045, partial [Alphaproteobacteria bacterium]|nr:hypothetical protein [Alphaproteobacteria bacterium]
MSDKKPDLSFAPVLLARSRERARERADASTQPKPLGFSGPSCGFAKRVVVWGEGNTTRYKIVPLTTP